MDADMADPTATANDDEQIELITGDEVAHEFELGDAPVGASVALLRHHGELGP